MRAAAAFSTVVAIGQSIGKGSLTHKRPLTAQFRAKAADHFRSAFGTSGDIQFGPDRAGAIFHNANSHPAAIGQGESHAGAVVTDRQFVAITLGTG